LRSSSYLLCRAGELDAISDELDTLPDSYNPRRGLHYLTIIENLSVFYNYYSLYYYYTYLHDLSIYLSI